MSIKKVALILIAAGLSACATRTPSSSAATARPINCPDSLAGYKEGEALADFVRGCMGKPSNEDHNPDGRFIYGYSRPDVELKFLFGPDQKLIRIIAYKLNQPAPAK
jgi:hypothetical protein